MSNSNQYQKQRRIMACWQSFRSLPGWVQIWVGGILVPVNAASFVMLDIWSGRAIAIAALLVVASNVPIMLWARGMTRLMAVPHLFIWGPLQFILFWYLRETTGGDSLSFVERAYVLAVLTGR